MHATNIISFEICRVATYIHNYELSSQFNTPSIYHIQERSKQGVWTYVEPMFSGIACCVWS